MNEFLSDDEHDEFMDGLYGQLPPDHRQLTLNRVDLLADQFEAAMRNRVDGGVSVSIESFLRDVPTMTEREILLAELIPVEMAIREEQGESPTTEEYYQRFPAYERIVDEYLNTN